MLRLNKISPVWACTAGLSAVLSATCGAASASSLIGDTINFQYFFPDESIPYTQPQVTTVAAGNSDAFDVIGVAKLDPEASGFKIPSFNTTNYFTSAPFNGFKLSSLDFNDASSITGYTLVTNMLGLDDSRIAFTGHTFDINWQGLSFDPNTYVNVDFKTSASNSTNIPTPALLPGLIGLGAAALRKRKGEQSEVVAAQE